jgi:hypothetical protein
MTLQSTASGGNPLTINEIKAEFGGPNTITSYRRGGGYVPNHQANSAIPTSGTVGVLSFLSADKTFRSSITSGTTSSGGNTTYFGYSKNLDGIGTFGSLTGYSLFGISASSTAQATIGGIYGTRLVIPFPFSTVVYSTTFILEGGDYTASATWTSLTMTQIASVTVTRATASGSTGSTTYNSGGNYTVYTWLNTQSINATGAVTFEIT